MRKFELVAAAEFVIGSQNYLSFSDQIFVKERCGTKARVASSCLMLTVPVKNNVSDTAPTALV